MIKENTPYVARNREPILEVLKQYLTGHERVLEVGSGTGEHAVFFAEKLPKIHWVTSDVIENHEKIKEWLKYAQVRKVPQLMQLSYSLLD